MKTSATIFSILLSVFATSAIAAHQDATNTTPHVYVIPIHGPIQSTTLYLVKRGFKEARQSEANAILLDMDTPGGRVDITEQIIRMLIDLPPDIDTYTFVNKDALSAGSLITITTRHIYMSPGSRIGASAIISATGDIKEGDLKEKHVSALTALVRSAAEHSGHDPHLAEAMIRKSLEYKLGDRVICPKGQLLTLNAAEAAEKVERDGREEPLLSSGIATNLNDVLRQANLPNATVTRLQLTDAEKLARLIEIFGFIFLAGGLLGIYIEFKTPGFGIPGLAGISLLAIFFWGHYIAGLSGTFELILFLIGILLLALEIFVIPGFGVAGISGLLLITLSLFLSMVQHIPGGSHFEIPAFQINAALSNLGLGLGISAILALIAARYLPKTRAFGQLVLNSSLDSKDGVIAAPPNSELIGSKGKALTMLRPAGTALINGKRRSVVTRGEFIDPGTQIIVDEAHGSRIIIRVDNNLENKA